MTAVETAQRTQAEPTPWHLIVTCDEPFVSPNRRAHHMVKSRITKAWREATYYAALQAKPKLPKGLARVRIDAVLRYTEARDRDDANMVDAVKPAVDALGAPFVRTGKRPAAAVGYSLIPDDTPTYLDGPFVRAGAYVGRGKQREIHLYVTDLSAVPAGRSWRPSLPNADGSTRLWVKRACNGCGLRLGDVTEDEVFAAFAGDPLPDVRNECPSCSAEVAS